MKEKIVVLYRGKEKFVFRYDSNSAEAAIKSIRENTALTAVEKKRVERMMLRGEKSEDVE